MSSDAPPAPGSADFPPTDSAKVQDGAVQDATVAPTVTAPAATLDEPTAPPSRLRRLILRLQSVLCVIRQRIVQFISLYLLTVFVLIIGLLLVEIQQRRDLLKQMESADANLKIRISNIIHYGGAGDSIDGIIRDSSEKHSDVNFSRLRASEHLSSVFLGNFSSRTLLMLSVLLAGWSGSLVGTVYRKENFEFRTSVIGLGASFVVWLGSHSTIQAISIGTSNVQGDPDCFDLSLIAFLAGFASHKVMQSLESLPIRGLSGRAEAGHPAPNAPTHAPCACPYRPAPPPHPSSP